MVHIKVIWRLLLLDMCYQKIYLHTIYKQTSLNKPSSKLKLCKKWQASATFAYSWKLFCIKLWSLGFEISIFLEM